MNNEFGLSIRAVLELEEFRNTKVIGGSGGLDKIVHSVNIMEVPDIFEWIKAGELLITAGYSIRDNYDAQQDLIPKLAGKGLVGLAIKPRRYLEYIPEIMIKQADKYDFPLLELSDDVSFSNLISPILSAIIDKQNNSLTRSLHAHQKFMEIITCGGNLNDMANNLAQLVENTVLIYDVTHIRSAWQTVNWSEEMIKAVWDSEMLANIEIPIQTQKCHMDLDGKCLTYLDVPIVSGSEFYGKVIVFETNRPLAYTDVHIIERLATVAALEIVNLLAFDQIERRYANEFLDQVLYSQIEGDCIHRANFFGWDLTKSYNAIIIQLEDILFADVNSEKNRMDMNSRIFKGINNFFKGKSRAVITGTKSEHIVLLMEVQSKDKKKLRQEIVNEVGFIRKALKSIVKDRKLTVGIGQYYSGIGGFQKSYKDAVRALRIGKEIGYLGKNVWFRDLGIYRLLVLIDKHEEMEEFLQESITPLLEYDNEKNTELIKTLEIFFKYQGNISKVSKELYTHYNTILYRLERVQEITGLNLADAEDRINIEVALKIRNLLKK